MVEVPDPPADLVASLPDGTALREAVVDAWRSGWAARDAEQTRRRRAGRVELAVRRDLTALGYLGKDRKDRAGRATLSELALVLARNVDSSEHPPTIAKLVQELRAVLALLNREGAGDSDDDAAFAARMGTPVGDAAQSGA